MAKPKRKRREQARRLHREPIVREIARVLETGTPTKFRWESACRHGLRAAMCLKGEKWDVADDHAGRIVTLALHRIGAGHRPSWHMSQPEPQEVEYWYCCSCGGFMDGGNDRPWCSQECYRTSRERQRHAAKLRADEAQRSATRIILTGSAEPAPLPLERSCRKCGKLFKPTHPDKRYCSRLCAATRVKYRTRSCLTCASAFQPIQHAQIVCGPDCAHELRLRRLRAQRVKRSYEKACTICGCAFTARRSTSVLCGSDDCRREDNLRRSRAYQARQRAESVAEAARL